MSPELLLKEPWRLSLFFVAVFGTLILCLGIILWQQARNQDLILLALQKSDRNNQTTWKAIEQTRRTYEAGRKTRGRLVALVAEEKQLNLAILEMNRRTLANQAWIRSHVRRLERRRR